MAASLFDKYGGFANISKIVLEFYQRAMDSDVIGPYFENVDMPNLIDHQTKFIASLMGGPASYTNDMLQQIHAPHHINKRAFDEMATLLKSTLEDAGMAVNDVATVMDEIHGRARFVIAEGSK
jgi:hemoglobin